MDMTCIVLPDTHQFIDHHFLAKEKLFPNTLVDSLCLSSELNYKALLRNVNFLLSCLEGLFERETMLIK